MCFYKFIDYGCNHSIKVPHSPCTTPNSPTCLTTRENLQVLKTDISDLRTATKLLLLDRNDDAHRQELNTKINHLKAEYKEFFSHGGTRTKQKTLQSLGKLEGYLNGEIRADGRVVQVEKMAGEVMCP